MGSSQAKLDIRIKELNVKLRMRGFHKTTRASIKDLVIQRQNQGFTCSVNSVRKLYKLRKSNGWRVAASAEEWIENYLNRLCLIKTDEEETTTAIIFNRRRQQQQQRQQLMKMKTTKKKRIMHSSTSGYSSAAENQNQNQKPNQANLKKSGQKEKYAANVVKKNAIVSKKNQLKKSKEGDPKEKYRKENKPALAEQLTVFDQMPNNDKTLTIKTQEPDGKLKRDGAFDVNRDLKIDYENELELVKRLKPGELFVDKSIELFDTNPNPKVTESDEERAIPIEWMTPEKIAANPLLVNNQEAEEGLLLEEIIEGELGDGQFCAALNVIMRYPHLLSALFPEENENSLLSSREQYKGYLRFRFWSFGEWVNVFVDDRLPTKKGWLITCRVASALNIFWPALMEKAFAKFVGSYKNLFCLTGGEILAALTGGLFLTFKTNQLSTLPRQYEFEDNNEHLIGFTVKKPSEETFMKENYCSVLALNKIHVKNRHLRIYTLKNVCEKTVYNKYPYYNADLKLANAETKRKILYPNRDDSVSWFAGFELRKMFDYISWLYTAYEENLLYDFVGQWKCENLIERNFNSYVKNTHYLLSINSTSATEKTEIILNLNLNRQDLSIVTPPDLPKIDLWLFRVDHLDEAEDQLLNRLGYVYYSFNDCDIQPLDLTSTQGSLTLSLYPGSYLLLPILDDASLLAENRPACSYMFRVGCRRQRSSTTATTIEVKELSYRLNEHGLPKLYADDDDGDAATTNFVNLITKKCVVCDEFILANEQVSVADRAIYHLECYESIFKCDNCGKQIIIGNNPPIKVDYNFLKCESCFNQS